MVRYFFPVRITKKISYRTVLPALPSGSLDDLTIFYPVIHLSTKVVAFVSVMAKVKGQIKDNE